MNEEQTKRRRKAQTAVEFQTEYDDPAIDDEAKVRLARATMRDIATGPVCIAEALAAAQLEITDPAKDAVNPHFKSRYADLATVLKTVRPVLARHGIALTQTTRVEDDGRVLLVTRLLWGDEELVGYYPIQPVKADPQGYGSAMTYARRYALQAIVGVAADDDDDGNAASAAPSKPAHDELATFIGQVKACNDLEELRSRKAEAARLGAAAVAAWRARGEFLKAAAEAP
jgi:hypothetical protein